MVEFWSLDLTSPIAGILVYTIAGLMLLLFYLYLLPRVDRGNHVKVRLFLEATVIVIVLTDILSFIIYPPAWNLGIVNDIFVYRQIPNGAHASSYVMVLSLVVIGFLRWDDALKGLMYAGLMVFIHEGMWFVPYYVTNWGDLNIPLDMAFVMWLLCITYISQKMYHLKVARTGYVVYGLFLLAWFMKGFEVTVKNTSRVFFRTPYYDSFTANAIEVTSWILVTAWFIYSLKLNGRGWKWFETFKAEFPSLRRLNMDGISEPRPSKRLSSTGIKKRLVHVSILVLMALGLVMMAVPVAHAAGPTVNNRAGTDVTAFTSITSVSIGPLTVSNIGDVLIVEFPIFFNIDSAGSGPCPCDPVTSITDTQGLTWTQQVSTGPIATSYSSSSNTDCHLDNCQMSEMWSATTTSTTATTIVVHFQSSKIEGAFGAEDAQGIVKTPVATAFCYLSTNCGTYSTTTGHPSTTTTNNLVNNELVVSAIGTQGGSFCNGGGSQGLIVDSSASPNWSTITGQINPAGTISGVQGCDVYGFTSSTVSGFRYPWDTASAGSSQRFALIGAVFDASGPGTVTMTATTVIAPSVTSLNYWLFPFLFLGMYDSLYLASGLWSRVSTKGMIWLLMSGFVIGSMIAVIMGMLGIQLVVMTILALIIYWWRIH